MRTFREIWDQLSPLVNKGCLIQARALLAEAYCLPKESDDDDYDWYVSPDDISKRCADIRKNWGPSDFQAILR